MLELPFPTQFCTVAMMLQRTYKVQNVKLEVSCLKIIFFLKTKENRLIKPPRCLVCIPRFQISKQAIFFLHKTLYERYATWQPKAIIFDSLQSVVTIWPTLKLLRWKRQQRLLRWYLEIVCSSTTWESISF
jgi:hypothetical protein